MRGDPPSLSLLLLTKCTGEVHLGLHDSNLYRVPGVIKTRVRSIHDQTTLRILDLDP